VAALQSPTSRAKRLKLTSQASDEQGPIRRDNDRIGRRRDLRLHRIVNNPTSRQVRGGHAADDELKEHDAGTLTAIHQPDNLGTRCRADVPAATERCTRNGG
jgi:hypothetical protein